MFRKVCSPATCRVLEPGAVSKTVRHDDVLVEVVGARGAVILHLVDHLADGEDGGRGGRGVGRRLGAGRGRRHALWAGLARETFICTKRRQAHTDRKFTSGWKTGAEMLERSSGVVGAVVKMHKADPLTRLHKQTQTTSSREDKGTDGDDVYEQVPAATSPQTPAKQRRSWTCSTRPAQLSR